VCLALGVLPIFVQEYRFNEEQVRPPKEASQGLPVARGVGNIRDVTDLLSRHELQDLRLQLTERHPLIVRPLARAPVDFDQRIVRSTGTHLLLERREPRARWQSQLFEAVLPDIDMNALLESEGQGRDSMMLERPS
jgi:hypothetical protein